jgi:hypothetical protein
MSTVDALREDLGMYFEGSRMPVQDARSLCACEQEREQVRMEQRGQRYLGGAE